MVKTMESVAKTKRARSSDTPTRILDIAERLAQRRGFNGFSYADVAAELEITTASLHYHFAGKAELGRAMLARYAERFVDALVDIETRLSSAPERLLAYTELYTGVLRERRLCLCGMLAAEFQTLPKPMRDSVIHFFDENEHWLTRVLEEGQSAGELQYSGSPLEAARMIVCGLEGAMLIARPYGDIARFQSAADQLLSSTLPMDDPAGNAGRALKG
jgi:TetR/AcrR family transcriptional repressor of nem operon